MWSVSPVCFILEALDTNFCPTTTPDVREVYETSKLTPELRKFASVLFCIVSVPSTCLSLEKYIELYLRNSVGHKGVTDFTNANQKLEPWFLRKIRSKLHDAFDVKVMMIFRDPVRRLFSEVSAFRNRKWVETDCASCRDYFMRVLHEGSLTGSEQYTLYYNNWKNAGYNIHPIKMERIYSGDKEDLEKFLGHSIELHPTSYYPERGVDAPYIHNVKCQKSDTESLSEEDYQYARGILDNEYTDFYNHL